MRLELTRRGDYAVRAMLALARPRDTPWLSVSAISASMAIPSRFLPQAMRALVVAGLVEGKSGRTGGYRLIRPASGISLRDVILALEPDDHGRQCVLRDVPCLAGARCAVHETFAGARNALYDRLASATLADLAAGPTAAGSSEVHSA